VSLLSQVPGVGPGLRWTTGLNCFHYRIPSLRGIKLQPTPMIFSWLKRKPTSVSVMKRALILKHVLVKAFAIPPAEIRAKWTVQEMAQFGELLKPVVSTLKEARIWSEAEQGEREFLQAGIDQVTPQQIIDASWLAESICCLSWAVQLVPEIPAYDEEANPDLVNAIPAKTAVKELIWKVRFRPREEIKKQREVAELWHWRARTRRLQEEGQLSGIYNGMTIEQVIESSALKGAAEGILPDPIGSDFSAWKAVS
jgi:hypothetical protein